MREERFTVDVTRGQLYYNAKCDHIILPRKNPCRQIDEILTTESNYGSTSLDTNHLKELKYQSIKKLPLLNDIMEELKDEEIMTNYNSVNKGEEERK